MANSSCPGADLVRFMFRCAASSSNFTNLENCSGEVQFRVSAAGPGGFGPPSMSSIPVRISQELSERGTVGVPLPPGRPTVIAVDGHHATIEWTPPAVDPKSAPLSGYQVEYRVYGTVDWMVANDVLTPNCSYTIENLRPNGVYEFRVRGRNADGMGAPSRSSGATHIKPAAPQRGAGSRPILPGLRPPGQPQLVEADIDWVKLEWASSEDGAGYIVEFREVGDPNWYTANQHPITMNCIHVEGLRPGSTYEFRVICVAGDAASLPSEVSDVISLRPLWKLGDLIVGHEYQFRVLAHNVVGCSEPSEASPPVTIKSGTGDAKYVEAERFGAVQLLMDEMVRESPPLPERDDSPPPLHRGKGNGNLQWRDPSLKEVIDYLDNPDQEKQLNATTVAKLQRLAVLDGDGVRMLAAVLQSSNDTAVKEEATAVLWNLSSADMLKPVILDAVTDALVQQVC
ncbi:unnamed protein product [Nippostrongylus brasiliensis]|uniref:Juxtamembrane domain-associated catenin (inferred by orthology to a C. elegans protein) n=1 Tax=Nippostrongylus brasiliensis TaxID=27835 RepID=A0A0N4YPS8_NIPBR|nr:unnamed protein product [Nippostrongylus brasiliensis]